LEQKSGLSEILKDLRRSPEGVVLLGSCFHSKKFLFIESGLDAAPKKDLEAWFNENSTVFVRKNFFVHRGVQIEVITMSPKSLERSVDFSREKASWIRLLAESRVLIDQDDLIHRIQRQASEIFREGMPSWKNSHKIQGQEIQHEIWQMVREMGRLKTGVAFSHFSSRFALKVVEAFYFYRDLFPPRQFELFSDLSQRDEGFYELLRTFHEADDEDKPSCAVDLAERALRGVPRLTRYDS
jgi:hypothetical protein